MSLFNYRGLEDVPQKTLCSFGLIQGSKDLLDIVDPKNAKIFFKKEELKKHCDKVCKMRLQCKNTKKEMIMNMIGNHKARPEPKKSDNYLGRISGGQTLFVDELPVKPASNNCTTG